MAVDSLDFVKLEVLRGAGFRDITAFLKSPIEISPQFFRSWSVRGAWIAVALPRSTWVAPDNERTRKAAKEACGGEPPRDHIRLWEAVEKQAACWYEEAAA